MRVNLALSLRGNCAVHLSPDVIDKDVVGFIIAPPSLASVIACFERHPVFQILVGKERHVLRSNATAAIGECASFLDRTVHIEIPRSMDSVGKDKFTACRHVETRVRCYFHRIARKHNRTAVNWCCGEGLHLSVHISELQQPRFCVAQCRGQGICRCIPRQCNVPRRSGNRQSKRRAKCAECRR